MIHAKNNSAVSALIILPSLLFDGILAIWKRLAFWRYSVIDTNELAWLQQYTWMTDLCIENLGVITHKFPLSSCAPRYQDHLRMADLIGRTLYSQFRGAMGREVCDRASIFDAHCARSVKINFFAELSSFDIAEFNQRRDELLLHQNARAAVALMGDLVRCAMDHPSADYPFL